MWHHLNFLNATSVFVWLNAKKVEKSKYIKIFVTNEIDHSVNYTKWQFFQLFEHDWIVLILLKNVGLFSKKKLYIYICRGLMVTKLLLHSCYNINNSSAVIMLQVNSIKNFSYKNMVLWASNKLFCKHLTNYDYHHYFENRN